MNVATRCVAAALCMLAAPVLAHAQSDWPSKPIRFIIPSPPGSSSDLLVRAIFEPISKVLGQPTVPEARAGAGGTLALEAVAKAAPDGHTLGMASLGSLGIGSTVYRNLRYDALRDFVGVARVASTANMVVINRDLPVRTLQELVTYAKANPGKLNFAQIGGPGTSFHLTWEMFTNQTGIRLVQIPFKANPEAIQGLLSGELQVAMGAPNQFLPQLQDGRLRALAVTTAKRDRAVPEVPTMIEAGYSNFDLPSWFGIVAPTGTPRNVVERLSSEVSKALASAEVAANLAKVGFDPYPQPAAEFDAFFRREIARWGAIAKSANVSIE
jgi:tripartite-type tricarboxylate transporter receptor subunit TctC